MRRGGNTGLACSPQFSEPGNHAQQCGGKSASPRFLNGRGGLSSGEPAGRGASGITSVGAAEARYCDSQSMVAAYPRLPQPIWSCAPAARRAEPSRVREDNTAAYYDHGTTQYQTPRTWRRTSLIAALPRRRQIT
jgi:hypothetical protein